MNKSKWERVETVSGDIYPEMIRGVLESNGIPVILSHQGAVSAYHVSVGPLSEVEIIVPSEFLEQARALIDSLFAGELEEPSDDVEPLDEEQVDDDADRSYQG
jgi:hypothetical protein